MNEQRVVFQSPTSFQLNVFETEGQPGIREVRPVITIDSVSLTVGFRYQKPMAFAYWVVASTNDLVTAWRVYSFLHGVRQFRAYHPQLYSIGFMEDVRPLLDEADGLSAVFDMSPADYVSRIHVTQHDMPFASQLLIMWQRIGTEQQEVSCRRLRQHIDKVGDRLQNPEVSALFGENDKLRQLSQLVETAEQRVRDAEAQLEHEQALIDNGLPPMQSLWQFMKDIGIDRIIFRWRDDQILPGFADGRFGTTDGMFLQYYIGEHPMHGIGEIKLMKHTGRIARDAFRTLEAMPIVIPHQGIGLRVVSVRWDHGTERFVLRMREVGSDDADYFVSVEELRAELGLTQPGTLAPLVPAPRKRWLRR